MPWTQRWHEQRDGMGTGMVWTQRWHGHSDAMRHSDTRTTRPQMNMGWMCAVGMQPAAARLDTRAVRVSRAFCVDCLAMRNLDSWTCLDWGIK